MNPETIVTVSDAAREACLRRRAVSLGWRLEKSRRRDPQFPDFGRYRIINADLNIYVAGGTPWDYSLTPDDVEECLA